MSALEAWQRAAGQVFDLMQKIVEAWPVGTLRPTQVSRGIDQLSSCCLVFQTGVVAICRGDYFDVRTVLLLLEIWHAVSDPLKEAHPFGFRPAGVAVGLSSISKPAADDGDDITFEVITRRSCQQSHFAHRPTSTRGSRRLQACTAACFKTRIAFAGTPVSFIVPDLTRSLW